MHFSQPAMKKYMVFALFAAAILLSMIREWSAPTTCSLPGVTRAATLANDNQEDVRVSVRPGGQGRPSLREGN